MHMSGDIRQKQRRGAVKRVFAFMKNPKKVDEMKTKFDDAVQLFHVSTINLRA